MIIAIEARYKPNYTCSSCDAVATGETLTAKAFSIEELRYRMQRPPPVNAMPVGWVHSVDGFLCAECNHAKV